MCDKDYLPFSTSAHAERTLIINGAMSKMRVCFCSQAGHYRSLPTLATHGQDVVP